MIGISDIVYGGLAPTVVAALIYAVARRVAPDAAWSAGIVAGFVAGAAGLTAKSPDVSVVDALERLARPTDSQGWLPLLTIVAVVPATLAALTHRRGMEWLMAPLCLGAPAWLLWSKYRASQQLREAGFADDAITPAGAAGVLLAIAAMTLAAWALMRRIAHRDAALPRTRSTLAVIVAVAGAMAAALTGALVIGQLFGALSAALGGCAVASWMFGDAAGPEAARGPIAILFAGLLAIAAAYSATPAIHALGLASALVVAIGWLPGEHRWPPARRRIMRATACTALVAAVVGHGVFLFLEADGKATDSGADEPSFDYMAPPPDSAAPVAH
jgi:hypothetical protein